MPRAKKITSLPAAWRLLAEVYENYAATSAPSGTYGLCWVLEDGYFSPAHQCVRSAISAVTRATMIRMVDEMTPDGIWAYRPSPVDSSRSDQEVAEQTQGRVLFCLLMAAANLKPSTKIT